MTNKINWLAIGAAATFSVGGSLFISSLAEDKSRGKELVILSESIKHIESSLSEMRKSVEASLAEIRNSKSEILERVIENATNIAIMEEREARFERHLRDDHGK